MDRRQLIKTLALSAATGLVPRWLLAQGSAHDAAYAAVITRRADFGRCIHLFGDSIMRGYALDVFADQLTGSEPLYAFRSIASMATLALTENNVPATIEYAGEISLGRIAALVDRGTIRPGDVVVLEDAGTHDHDPDSYERMWLALRTAVTGKIDATCVMMTMFDYPDGTNLAADPSNQYDAVFQGRTMNDATTAAATAHIPSVGKTHLINMNAKMDAWRAAARSRDRALVMRSDGVHPNVWGQMLMTGELLRAIGYGPTIRTIARVIAIARNNRAALSYGSKTFSAARAEAYARHCFLGTGI